jgi:RHS repeat-associated protein
MKSVLRITLMALLFTVAMQAQDTLGFPPFYSIQGGVNDSVKINDGAISLSLPVRSKAGVIPISYSLHANTAINGTGSGGAWPINPGWSANVTSGYFYGMTFENQTSRFLKCPDGSDTTQLSRFVITDAFGTVHPFGNNIIYDTSGCLATQKKAGVATDGSGYYAVVTGISGWTVYSRSGAKISFGSSPYKDVNGNVISTSTCGSNCISYTDPTGTSPMSQTVTYDSTGSQITSAVHTWIDAAGNPRSYSINYTAYSVRTNFGCPAGLFPQDGAGGGPNYYPSSISTPEGNYTITYEATPNNPGWITGRIAKIVFPSGASIQYTYTGGNNGLVCTSTGSGLRVPVLTRIVTGSDGVARTWKYDTASLTNATVVTDPSGNDTVYTFSATGSGIRTLETQRQVYQGSRTTGTLLMTQLTCYNGNLTNCAAATGVSTPTKKDVYATLTGMTQSSLSETSYDSYGNMIEDKEYDFGGTSLITDRVVTYGTYSGTTCSPIGNNIQDRVCTDITTDSGSHVLSKITNSYDTKGNMTTSSRFVAGLTSLTASATYNANGTALTATDVNGAQTTNTYGACNGTMPTSVAEPLSLSRSMTWDCNGGVLKTITDENGKITTFSYLDANNHGEPYWRPFSVTDPLNNTTNFTYSPTTFESAMLFNNGASTVDALITSDGFGRKILDQTRQGPGLNSFDTVQYTYDGNGRLYKASVPCTAPAGSGCTTPVTTYLYDALNRPTTTTDGGGGTLTYTYTPTASKYDVTVATGPTPAGENTKRRQMEYDGAGRLTSVCEITSASGSGSCAQGSAKTGFWTKYAYDTATVGSNTYQRKTVTQNAQGTAQTRTYLSDDIGRLVSETNPENGTNQYFYDAAPTTPGVACAGTYNGDLVKTYDANGNTVCNTYDALHRMLLTTYPAGPNATATPAKYFAYDVPYVYSQIPNTQQNLAGRLSAAGTCASNSSCAGSTVVGEELSYSARGETTDLWQFSPHQSTYYHTVASYWANGVLNTLSGVPGQTGWTFGVDGEGRWSSAVEGANNLVTSASFNAASQPLTVNLGLGDSDSYLYDPNTDRMTKYTFTAGATPKSMVGNLTWNPNGSLSKLDITDGFNAGGTHTCKYGDPAGSVAGYDDLGRLAKVDCGASNWQQNFSFDAFGNITKSVPTGGTGIAWNPGYNAANNHYMLAGTTYDANGNLLTDSFHTYTWDADGHIAKIDSSTCGTNGTCLTYDAFGRPVERSVSATYSEILYSQLGKTAVMNGNTIIDVYIPLPGGSTYHMVPGSQHFWHPDWLGTIRLSSGRTTRTAIYDRAFAPFGEVYLNFGATDRNNFTGDTQDILPGADTPGNVVAGLFDTPNREMHPFQGRWLSPDPAGLSATDPGNPQSWNRYAYAANAPLTTTDPSGTESCDPFGDLPCEAAGDSGLQFFAPIFTGIPHSVSSSILPGEDSIFFPTRDLFTTIWQDVLGLPGSSCDLEFGGCGSVGSDFIGTGLPGSRCDWWCAQLLGWHNPFFPDDDPGVPFLRRYPISEIRSSRTIPKVTLEQAKGWCNDAVQHRYNGMGSMESLQGDPGYSVDTGTGVYTARGGALLNPAGAGNGASAQGAGGGASMALGKQADYNFCMEKYSESPESR